jgi:hypothetical protein
MRDVDQGWHDLLNRLPTLKRAYNRKKRIRLLTFRSFGISALLEKTLSVYANTESCCWLDAVREYDTVRKIPPTPQPAWSRGLSHRTPSGEQGKEAAERPAVG